MRASSGDALDDVLHRHLDVAHQARRRRVRRARAVAGVIM